MSWIQTKITLFTVLIIIAAILRFYNFSNRIEWVADSGRDYLVAHQLSTSADSLLVGPTASGFRGVFYYPPYYYYLLSGTLRIYDSRVFLTGVFTLLGTMSVILIYKIGELISGKRTGAVSAALYAIGALPVAISETLHGAAVAIPFFIFVVYLYFYSYKKNEFSIALLSFLLGLIVGVVSYLPLFMLSLIYIHFMFFFRVGWKTKAVTTALIMFYLIVLMTPLISYFGWRVIMDEMLSLFRISHDSVSAYHFIRGPILLVKELTRNNPQYILGYAAVSVVTLGLFISLKSKIPHLWKLCVFLVFGMYSASIIKQGEFYEHWTWVLVPVLTVLAGHIFSEGTKSPRRVFRWVFVILFCLYAYIIAEGFGYLDWESNTLSEYESVAETIKTKFGYSDDRHMFVYEPNGSSWESAKLWFYFLDDKRRQFKLTNFKYNIAPVRDYPNEILVVSKVQSSEKIRFFLGQDRGIYSFKKPEVYPSNDGFILYLFRL